MTLWRQPDARERYAMLLYLALGAGLLWLLLWSQKAKPILKFPQWRISSAVLATGAFAAAFFMAMEKQVTVAIVLMVVGLWLAASARFPRAAQAQPSASPAAPGPMTMSDAYAILDLKPGCTREDVQEAYLRLMKVVHPDRGGGAGLATKLNAARDKLLKG
ncbi:molecular chaperone DnaJ [soil metagenome]